jgi:taurine transport system permease protein
MTLAAFYVAIFVGAWLATRALRRQRSDFTSLKTVTFGDESAVRPDRVASVLSILAIFLIWGAFTGSRLTPLHVPGPFKGDLAFTYTATNAGGSDDATVRVRVHDFGAEVPAPDAPASEGFAQDDAATVAAWRSVLIRAVDNDGEGAVITAINGQPVTPDVPVLVDSARVVLTSKGSLNVEPDKGWQMEPIWLPAPEAVVARLVEIARVGYRNFSLWDHLGASLARVLGGFALGALVGVPLGYANSCARCRRSR